MGHHDYFFLLSFVLTSNEALPIESTPEDKFETYSIKVFSLKRLVILNEAIFKYY